MKLMEYLKITNETLSKVMREATYNYLQYKKQHEKLNGFDIGWFKEFNWRRNILGFLAVKSLLYLYFNFWIIVPRCAQI